MPVFMGHGAAESMPVLMGHGGAEAMPVLMGHGGEESMSVGWVYVRFDVAWCCGI